MLTFKINQVCSRVWNSNKPRTYDKTSKNSLPSCCSHIHRCNELCTFSLFPDPTVADLRTDNKNASRRINENYTEKETYAKRENL